MKEFLRLDNKLILKLKIKPLSPLLIKLGNKEKDSEGKDGNYIGFLTTESGTGTELKYNGTSEKVTEDGRKGEIYIPGSSLRGAFRDRTLDIFENDEEEVKKLYGKSDDDKSQKTRIFIGDAFLYNVETRKRFYSDEDIFENDEEEVKKLYGKSDDDKSQKTRIFIGDAFLYNVETRKRFYSDEDKISESLKDILKSRSITPIDHFSGKATVPLKFEYTTENFLSEITVNNISLKELKIIYFILRDSINGELRIGNSKTRGFGQIELEIDEMVYYKYCGKKELVKDMKKYFERVEEKSIKIGDKYLCEALRLKDKFNKIDIENPNEFIKALFAEVE